MRSSVPFHAGAHNPARSMEFSHYSTYFGDIEAAKTKFENWEGSRTARQARDSSEPRVIISVTSGLDIQQGESQVPRGRLSVVPYWSIEPWRTVVRDQATSHQALTVPIASLGLPFSMMRGLMGRDISLSPFGKTITAHVKVLNHLPELNLTRSAVLAPPTTDIVRLAFAAAAGDEFLGREPLARTLGLRALAFLRLHADDARLTMQDVANGLGVSRRTLFRAFAELGVSAQDWLREERLLRAATMLQSGFTHLAVSAVARQCGFPDHSSFSRAFRHRFGCAPSDWQLLPPLSRARLERRTVLSPLDTF
ncbi:MAG: helix-turn-helix domain-containing protein [Microbacterium sp.]